MTRSRAPRSHRRGLPSSRLAALGTAGVVVGHTLAYVAAEPTAASRALLLDETGHTYWHAAVAAAVVAALFSVISHVVAQFRSVRVDPLPADSIPRAGARLAVFQVSAYALMEVAERISAHQPVVTMFAHHLFVVGVVVQLAVAGVFVQALRLVGRAAAAIATKLARSAFARDDRAAHVGMPRPGGQRLAMFVWPGPSRAPPFLA